MPPSLSAICTLTGSYGRAASRVYDGILPRRYGLDNPLSQRPTRNRLEASRASRTRGGRFSRFTRGTVRGTYYSHDPEAREDDLNDFLADVSIIEIDKETCKVFGRERGRLRAKKKTVADFDLLIGATALQHNMTLLTNNRRHFHMVEGLRIESVQHTLK